MTILKAEYAYIKSGNVHILRYVVALIILNFISMTGGGWISHLARFGRVKWKSFHRYAYCRMAGEKKKRSFQSACSAHG